MMKKVAVTGATGFVGKRFMEINRDRFDLLPLSLRWREPADIDLAGVSSVVHLAGKAHQMEPIEDRIYFDVNYELTRQLAERAIQQRVKHFIYISSTKVYGDDIHEVLNEHSPCTPGDAYGGSKWKAEQYLASVHSNAFKVAVVRPPLVYGPGVKGNMIKLLQLADKKYPLPFGNSGNSRSMVFVDNLVALIDTIIDREAHGVFIGGDSKPVSTDALILLMRHYLSNPKGLLTIPGFIRPVIRKLKPALYTRLFGSFVVDNSATNERLHFVPPYSTAEGVAEMVKWYKGLNA